jgi:hypothetical protein
MLGMWRLWFMRKLWSKIFRKMWAWLHENKKNGKIRINLYKLLHKSKIIKNKKKILPKRNNKQ